jgi:hypothetical protein
VVSGESVWPNAVGQQKFPTSMAIANAATAIISFRRGNANDMAELQDNREPIRWEKPRAYRVPRITRMVMSFVSPFPTITCGDLGDWHTDPGFPVPAKVFHQNGETKPVFCGFLGNVGHGWDPARNSLC